MAATRLDRSQISAMILEFAPASRAFTALNAIPACLGSLVCPQKAAKPAIAHQMALSTPNATKTAFASAKKASRATSATNAREIIITKKTWAAKSATIVTISSNLNTTSTRMSSTDCAEPLRRSRVRQICSGKPLPPSKNNVFFQI